MSSNSLVCGHCGSSNVIRWGASHGTPTIQCKDCGKHTNISIIDLTKEAIEGVNESKTIRRIFKRVFVGGDLHCGHLVGLTPPNYQIKKEIHSATKMEKFAQIEKECWEWFTTELDKLKPFDVAIINGDCIDGRGERSGSTELIAVDRLVQCEMAVECIRYIGAKQVVMTYGTPYHTGQLEDFENIIAKELNAKIGSHEWVNVNGCVFDVKHKIGSSIIPHGRATAGLRDALWASLWSSNELTPKANVIIRSHIHASVDAYTTGLPRVVVTPALQGMGSRFGARECSGMVSFGFVYFDVYPDGKYRHEFVEADIKSQHATITNV